MQVLGHRGWPVPSRHPENTVAAMVAALDAGADGVEVDVQLTADGVAVCFHDDHLERVTGRPGSVRTSTWDQLSRVRLHSGHAVPLLAEVLAAFALGRPDLSRALLCDVGCDPMQAVRACVADGSAGLHLALRTALAAPEALRAARRAGVQVRVWTVNRLVDAQLLELLGAQAVITDRPDRLVAGLRQDVPALSAG